MNSPVFRIFSCSLIIIGITAPNLSPVAASTAADVARNNPPSQISQRPKIARYVRVAGSQHRILITGPSGCAGNGSPSFDGIPSASNFPLGQYSAVVGGSNNEACENFSIVGAGDANTIGGGVESGILAGYENEILGQTNFIGAGTQNIIGAPAARSPFDSGIVGGTSNSLDSPDSFIGSGVGNSISSGGPSEGSDGSAIVAGDNNSVSQAQAGAIVAGQGNSVSGFSSIVGAGVLNVATGDDAGIFTGYYNSVSGANSGIASGQSNQNNADNSFIAGGSSNRIAYLASFIGAGQANTIFGVPTANASFGSISGGYKNSIVGAGSGNSEYSAIGGGYENTINAEYAAIGGGANNSVSGPWAALAGGSANSASGGTAAIGGGYANTASGQYAAIPGGHNNIASGSSGAIGGGATNTVSGQHATVPGGQSNIAAGTNSFAAGTSSDAATNGAFVWSDYASGATVLKSTTANQFLARASGGFLLYSSATLKSGVDLAPGSGSWSSLSDRAAKTAIKNVDDARILAKVSSLPVSEWSYTEQGARIRHLGPMAQDFRAAFGLGEDEKHISAVDEEGVALAAIKALQEELVAKDRKLSDLDAKYARMEQRLDALERHTSKRV